MTKHIRNADDSNYQIAKCIRNADCANFEMTKRFRILYCSNYKLVKRFRNADYSNYEIAKDLRKADCVFYNLVIGLRNMWRSNSFSINIIRIGFLDIFGDFAAESSGFQHLDLVAEAHDLFFQVGGEVEFVAERAA